MFNLNSNEFDGSVLFNDGVAGIVENVTMSCEEKKPEDKEGSPDLKIFFTDSKGGKINFGIWRLNPNSEQMEKDVKNLGTKAKHIFHTIFGSTYTIPAFKDDVALIQGLRDAINRNPKELYRITTNYGTVDRPKAFMQVKPYPLFMESMKVAREETKLSDAKGLFKKPVADATPMTPSKPATSWVEEPETSDETKGDGPF